MKWLSDQLSFVFIRLITLDYFVIKRTLKKNKGDPRKVLDLGSGNGYLAPLFRSGSYLGIEIDPFLVEIAKDKFPKYNFRIGDVTKLDLGEIFDLIVIIGVLHHINNAGVILALKCAKKHLTSDGKIIIIEATPPVSKYNFIGKLIRSLDKGSYIRGINAYKRLINNFFQIHEARYLKGGIVDYAFIVLGKNKS